MCIRDRYTIVQVHAYYTLRITFQYFINPNLQPYLGIYTQVTFQSTPFKDGFIVCGCGLKFSRDSTITSPFLQSLDPPLDFACLCSIYISSTHLLCKVFTPFFLDGNNSFMGVVNRVRIQCHTISSIRCFSIVNNNYALCV